MVNPMIKPKRGFTLVELLVSVVLMLILVGAVVEVFRHTSNAVSQAESTMEVYQNARAIFELISRDLASVQVGNGQNLILRQVANNIDFLEFHTITSWLRNGIEESGLARIAYRAQRKNNRWTLYRLVTPQGDPGPLGMDVLGQYLATDGGGNPSIRVEYFDTGVSRFKAPDASHPNFTFDENNLPSALRISMLVTDRHGRITRPFSRVISVATGVN